MWDNDAPRDRGGEGDRSRPSRGGDPRDGGEDDDLVPYNGSAELSRGFGIADSGGTGTGGPQTPKAKAGLLVVVILMIMTTVILCCVAIGQAARLIDVDPARL